MSTMPIDRVQTIMMTQSTGHKQYVSPWHAAREIWETEGATGFYAGWRASLVRTFAGQAAALSVYGRALDVGYR